MDRFLGTDDDVLIYDGNQISAEIAVIPDDRHRERESRPN